ncbi:MAG: hypothetical protein EBR40_03245 [Proteobacteria bacterium]|nr:hypothetical protein [Pseudomonadota bacterium]
MKIYQLLPLVLVTGCAYRYGTGYFMNDVPVHAPPATVPVAPPDPPPVASAEPAEEDCEQMLEKLEVTNKLDSKNNTITTTAVTKHERSRRCP